MQRKGQASHFQDLKNETLKTGLSEELCWGKTPRVAWTHERQGRRRQVSWAIGGVQNALAKGPVWADFL